LCGFSVEQKRDRLFTNLRRKFVGTFLLSGTFVLFQKKLKEGGEDMGVSFVKRELG
jgi:hypothetical protein